MITNEQREAIQLAINEYDSQKGPMRRLLGDHPAIRELKQILHNPDVSIATIQGCFARYPTKAGGLSDKVRAECFRLYCLENSTIQVSQFNVDVSAGINILNLQVEPLQFQAELIQIESLFPRELPPNLIAMSNLDRQLLEFRQNYLQREDCEEVIIHFRDNRDFNEYAYYDARAQEQHEAPAAPIPDPAPAQRHHNNFNHSQSTHTASVHKTASESALKLLKNYESALEGDCFSSQVERVTNFINDLPEDSEIKNVVKRSIREIFANENEFIDPVSQVSLAQLVLLAFLAIHDVDRRSAELDDARVAFIQALWEVQREYNLTEKGADLNPESEDEHACPAGAFNKVIERLVGVHPDCYIEFITKRTAALKFPIIINEEIERYLNTLANPQDSNSYLRFINLMIALKDQGLSVIWDGIQENVKKRVLEEFNVIFTDSHGNSNSAFLDLINAWDDIEINDLSHLKGVAINSLGYRKYCSQLLRQSGLFASIILKPDELLACSPPNLRKP